VLVAATAPLTAFTVALLLVWRLSRGRFAEMVVDRPNDRSLHMTPTPRSGGLGLHAGVLLAWPLAGSGVHTVILISQLALLMVAAWDDLRGLPVFVRFATHLLAGGATAALLLPDVGIGTVLVAMLGMVWMMNLYNFMDGSDGLAGGMAVFGFGCYGLAACLAGDTPFALLNFSIAAAAAAFLFFNFHPARIFMGDAGSVPLGYLAGSLGLAGFVRNHWDWWFPFLVFSPFVVDASATLVRRLYARAAVWRAHRDHYYQRLVQLGWGHRRTALVEYALMGVCGAAALAGVNWSQQAQLLLLVTATVVYAVLIISIEIVWRNFLAARNHGP
jgi:UDP-N-acetylmuramyl pentapeptide phosphotransferase/UDP-N-acetylglucosamine-1-phosphate transferase